MAIPNQRTGKVGAPPDKYDPEYINRIRLALTQPPEAAAPTFAQLTALGVAFFTGEIDGTTTAATVIGTVPTGKTFFSLGTYVLTQSVDSSSGSTTVTLKVDNGTLVVRSAVACGSSTVRNLQVLGGSTANNTQLDAGGGDITVTVTSAATCPEITLVVGVFGALFDV